jgi:hypothetical protein
MASDIEWVPPEVAIGKIQKPDSPITVSSMHNRD